MTLQPGTAHAQPAHRGCHFRASIWDLVQETSVDANYAIGYDSTDAVNADRAPLDEQLYGALARYRYPRGYSLLQTAWSAVWDHIWSVAYWQALLTPAPYDDPMYSFYNDKVTAEQSAAYSSMNRLWNAAKAMC